MRNLYPYIDFFLPKSLLNISLHDELLWEKRTQVVTMMIGFLAGVFFSLYCYYYNLIIMTYGCFLFSIVAPLCLLIYRNYSSILGQNIFLFFGAIMILTANWGGGLGAAPPIIWLCVYPVLPAIMKGLNYALFWSFALYLAYGLLEYGHTIYGIGNNQFTEYSFFQTNLVNIGIGITINILSIAYLKSSTNSYQKKLKKSEEEKSKLIQVVFHDFTSYLLAAENYFKRDQEQSESYENGLKQLRYIRDLLMNLKSKANSPKKEKINLNHLMNELIDTFQFQLTEKNLTITKKLSNTSIVAIPTVLKYQILSNLLSNAIKFSIPGHNIDISSVRTPHYYSIIVTNSTYQENLKILKNFVQGYPLSTTPGTFGESGNGIGLKIAQNMARQYGGEIICELKNESVCFIYRQAI